MRRSQSDESLNITPSSRSFVKHVKFEQPLNIISSPTSATSGSSTATTSNSSSRYHKRAMSSLEFHQNVVDTSSTFAERLKHDEDQFVTNKYESLDYDKIYNLINVKDPHPLRGRMVSRKQLAKWLVMFLIGICTGVVAFTVDVIVENLTYWKFSIISTRINECLSNHCLWQPLMIWIFINIVLSSIGCLLVVCFAPAARASGLPSVKSYLNGISVPNVVDLKTLIAKMFGVAICIPGGLSWGKEGPMIHSGAIVGAGISQGFSPTLGIDLKIFKYFRNDKDKRDFVSGGAAAGVAAAFGAPVGGLLFSLEEGVSFWNQSLTWRIFFCSMISTFTLNVLISLIHGHFGDLSDPSLTNFGKFSNITYQWYELPMFILMGAFGGLIGALFNHVNTKLVKFRLSYLKTPLLNLIECLLMSSICAIIPFSLSYFMSSDCRAIGQNSRSKLNSGVQMMCGDSEYNVISSLFFQTPEKSVESMFHDPPGSHNPLTLFVFFLVNYLLCMTTYGMAIPSGVFVPSLLIGSIWGRLAGILINEIYPGANVNPGKYALIGAAATLAGILRMTVSLSVILIEATGDITLGLPIMFSVLVAKLVGDFFNEGLLEMHMEVNGLPFLNWSPPPGTDKLNVQHVMTHPVVVIKEVDSVGRIVDILKKTKHNGFPVVSHYHLNSPDLGRFGILKGLILRHQLVTLIKNKCFLDSDIRLKPDDFQTHYPRYLKIDEVEVNEHDRRQKLDLTPYLNFSPYSLTDNSNFPRVFRLFRGLGLRHLVIVDHYNHVVGIVTRIDIARYKVHIHLNSTSVQELDIMT